MSAPRGLKNFIRDIRNCGTKEEEKKRVNVELANIRVKFKQSDKLSHYDRKKCVARAVSVRGRAALRVPARRPP
jgi:AP-2 complex subunit alpha